MTKEFEQQRSHNVMIFIDRTESPLFESVVTFTASIVRAVLKQNSPASFVSIGKEQTIFPLDNGDTQLQQILCHLAKVQADSVFPLSQSVDMELRKIYEPVTVILVTSNLSPDIQKAADCAAIKIENVWFCRERKSESTFTPRNQYNRNSKNDKYL